MSEGREQLSASFEPRCSLNFVLYFPPLSASCLRERKLKDYSYVFHNTLMKLTIPPQLRAAGYGGWDRRDMLMAANRYCSYMHAPRRGTVSSSFPVFRLFPLFSVSFHLIFLPPFGSFLHR